MGQYYCRVCNRRLSDSKSIKNGIGPICAGKEIIDENQTSIFNDEKYDLKFDPEIGDIIARRESSGIRHFNFPHKIVEHSPTGMEWGYGGSGPADFALNALLMFVPEKTARECYQDFKWLFVANLPENGGCIPGRLIKKFINEEVKNGRD